MRSALRRKGYSRLDLLLTVTMLALLGGAAIPLTSRVVTHQARRETRAALERLERVLLAQLHGADGLPEDITELLDEGGRRGGSGARGCAAVEPPARNRPARWVDGWQRDLRIVQRDNALSLTSAGEDGEFGSPDDLSRDLSVPWIRREKTLAQLRVLNRAIVLYNGDYQTSDPLPADWGPALDKLVARGFLASANPYRLDGWGTEFVADPAGSSPLVRVSSRNVSAGDTQSLRGAGTSAW